MWRYFTCVTVNLNSSSKENFHPWRHGNMTLVHPSDYHPWPPLVWKVHPPLKPSAPLVSIFHPRVTPQIMKHPRTPFSLKGASTLQHSAPKKYTLEHPSTPFSTLQPPHSHPWAPKNTLQHPLDIFSRETLRYCLWKFSEKVIGIKVHCESWLDIEWTGHCVFTSY